MTPILLAALLLAPSDWSVITISNSNDSAFVLADHTLSGDTDGIRAANVLMVLREDDAQGFAAVDARVEIDCPTNRVRIMSSTNYDVAGLKLTESALPGEWEAARPGSGFGNVAEIICKRQSPDLQHYSGPMPILPVRAELERRKAGKS
jgi:hypothetical protein